MRRLWPDGVLVAVCTLAQLTSLRPGDAAAPGATAGGLALVAAVAAGLALWWRRRAPLTVVGGAATAYVVQAAAVGPVAPVTVAAGCYAAARFGPVLWGPVAGLLAVAVVAVCVVLVGAAGLAATYAVVLVLAVLAGVLVVARRARLEAMTLSAVVAERLRIARDLHDVVGHGMGAITVQAGAGRMALQAGAEAEVGRALLSIERAGRSVLREVRWLVGVLRERPEQVTAADVVGLADAARSAGFVVDARFDERLGAVPPQVVEVLYRIVQEALTNAFRHSGSDAAQVAVAVSDQLVVTVLDAGVGAPAPDGHGLLGMRERVAAAGGTLCAGPRPDGPGWQVRASLPIRAGRDGGRLARADHRRRLVR